MTRAYVGMLTPKSLGFDCNQRVSAEAAREMRDAGFAFCVRYVRRVTRHDHDLSVPEIMDLLDAGLGVSIVQHVASPGESNRGWIPTQSLGASYGAIAAEEARALGIPPNVVLWCDLEGVTLGTPAVQVLQFCNAWYDAVRSVHYDAGLYVGYDAGLTAYQLYWKTKFRRFWGAYNLNSDSVPLVRGTCMSQLAYPPVNANEVTVAKYMSKYQLTLDQALTLARRVKGVPFQYDPDIITGDQFNNLPAMLLPRDPG